MNAVLEYFDAVEATDLTDSSKRTYTDHAAQFARWMVGKFEPGAGSGQQGGNQREDIEALLREL